MKSLPSDERRTPRWFFRLCSSVWGPFDLDACAAPWNAQVRRYVTKEQDIFAGAPRAQSAWRNPPYSRGNLARHVGQSRQLVLEGEWGRSVNLIPADPSTDWWRRHVAAPEGRPLRADWLHRTLPGQLGNATRYVSQHLVVTVVLVDERLPYESPSGLICDGAGAMQPSAVVVFERPDVRTRRRSCNPVASTRRLPA